MKARLEVKKASKEYTRNGRVFLAVNRASLVVREGEFASVVGQSGSGKSSLLNLIAGLLLPSSGEILIDGKNAALMNDRDASLFRNSAIGHIPQGWSLLPNLTVLDNVRLPFFLAKREGNPDQEAARLLTDLGIEALAKSYPSDLSGGEAKRVAVARALVNKPALLLADEPTENLDRENAKAIVALLKRAAKKGTSVVMVTHDERAAKAADAIYIMDGGKLVKKI